MDDTPTSVLLGALVALLILSGFFSISETSMMALNRYRLKHLAQSGHRGAKLTTQLLARTDKLLGVILLGNNLVNAACATLVTIITVRLVGEGELALSIGTLAVTFAILVFSEITPKIMGAAYPERIALPLSFILTPLLKLFYPVIWFVNLFVQALLWILRLKPGTANSSSLSLEELRTMVLEAGHYIPKKHQSILINLFELENITVDDVMTPRNQIEAIDIDAPAEDIRSQLSTSHHTRILVYQGQLDNIIGLVHVRKVLHQTQTGELDADALRDILREPYFIPAGTALFTQLQHFQENQRRLGMVVDEYGELLGLVSLEDILEEIVGEFTTHAPAQGSSYRHQDDGSWLVDGSSQLRDLNRKLGLQFPLDGPKTLNGLILEHLEDIPEAGISLKISGVTLEIMQTQDRSVKGVRIFPAANTAEQ
ncbi:MAG: HlyC/CorC family transporter [Sulfurimicrobium sp.]|nr:HlyC/CorC family transporter [Sulfurimicrobium sp.]MDP1703558.1 HlyC/CorC family transporter [Sulfurimicrobium sp.]MDP2198096.1 HlyC/CorC family transporter [Sulfurimicrobium sp.]MDP3688723.1 HlyC/CorC family transporter [Sulfurimicrobium sp.]